MAIADEIDAQSDTFSELESRDTGKPLFSQIIRYPSINI